MANNGGKRPGAGRKPKIEEAALIERLSPMDDTALKALKDGLTNGDHAFVKLFMEYRYGKPKEKVEHSGGLSIVWNEILNNGTDD
jgi:hypothetical protein